MRVVVAAVLALLCSAASALAGWTGELAGSIHYLTATFGTPPTAFGASWTLAAVRGEFSVRR